MFQYGLGTGLALYTYYSNLSCGFVCTCIEVLFHSSWQYQPAIHYQSGRVIAAMATLGNSLVQAHLTAVVQTHCLRSCHSYRVTVTTVAIVTTNEQKLGCNSLN